MPETTLTRLTDHVYWMSPGEPDRPSLCAVTGTRSTLMLDGAASAAHARLFLDALKAAGVPAPGYLALTHWHWDHVFGAAEVGVPVIAHATTAEHLAVLASYKWDDKALDLRVAAGAEIVFSADNIKRELPEPREVVITPPDIIFARTLDLDLGGATCHIQHVGGDHADDSCVMHILPDRVLFLGDCLYDAIYAPTRHYTTARLFPLLNTLLDFDADLVVEGHTEAVMNRAEFEALAAKMRLVGTLVEQIGADDAAVLEAAQVHTKQPPDDDLRDLVRAFIAGRGV